MVKNNEEFNRELNKLVVPLRFSIMALLCAKKSTVFDDSIIRLMRYIYGMKFEGKKIYKLTYAPYEEEDKESSSLLEDDQEQLVSHIQNLESTTDGNIQMLCNERYLSQVQLIAYIVDEMSMEPTIKPTPPGFKNTLRT